MKYYEYDADGFLVGWYDASVPRVRSTAVEPTVECARWNGTAWVRDTSQRDSKEAKDTADALTRQQAIARLSSYDPATATASDVRETLAAVILFIKKTI